jgi:hypothetical protein
MTHSQRVVRSAYPEAMPVISIGFTPACDSFAIWSSKSGGRLLCAWVSSIASAWEQAFIGVRQKDALLEELTEEREGPNPIWRTW